MGENITRTAKQKKNLQKSSRNSVPTNSEPANSVATAGAALAERPHAGHIVQRHPVDRHPGEKRTASNYGELRLEEAQLHQLFETTPEAIALLDTNNKIILINPEFTRLFGYTREESLGKRLKELIVPRDKQQEVDWMVSATAKGQKVTAESKRRHKDGSLVDVSVLATPIKGGGEHMANYVIFRDITEQKRAEALQSALYRIAQKTSSAEDLQEFYAAIHGIVGELMYAENFYIALYDRETRLLSFPYFVDQEDPIPDPQPLGKGLTEYVLRTGQPLLAVPEVFQELMRRGEVESVGAPSLDWLGVPLKTGSKSIGVVVVQSYTGNVRFGNKEKEILTFVSQHLASAIEHKRHEQALRESEARYRSLVQRAVYGIYRSTLDGQFLDVNPAVVSMLGYGSADEVLALDPQKDLYVNPAERLQMRREYLRAGHLDNFEVKWKCKDGNPITVRLSGRAVSLDGNPKLLEVIAEDVTEQRVLEDQFRQAQKMEAVGRLAGGVAHDFNNLLMVISGYTEVLLNQLGTSDPRRKKAEAIKDATGRAATLTRQLLAFGRKQVLELKVINLDDVVADISKLLRPLMGDDIELVISVSPDAGCVKADPGQIEQVIMNLAVNARDAMPNGGKLIIETRNVELDDSYRRGHATVQSGSYVMLAISDTGCGMDAETQSRIFEPFFTTKEKGKGTGLGLSTVYGIVKQSGGYVFVYSGPARGTAFKVYLPRVEETVGPEVASPRTRVTCRGSEIVLLVEDEDSVRELVSEALETQGYKVLTATRGDQALKIAGRREQKIDLMVTDVVMPGMSGRELAKLILQGRPQARVLFLSGYTEDAVLHQGALDTGTAFLQKPFTLDALACKVREILDA